MQTITTCEELFRLLTRTDYRSRYLAAKATRTCVSCGKPTETFRDCLARLEYDTSAICEECQDRYFKISNIS
jgi:hypothetical protein